MRSKKYFNLLGFYFVVLHLCPLLVLVDLLPGGKPAYIVDIATVLPILLTLYYWYISVINSKVSHLDFAVTAYLIISVLSVVLYLQPDNPSDMTAYFYGIHHFVLPIFLYFAVKSFSSSQQYSLLRFICYLNVTAVIIGIILFFGRPDFYKTKLLEQFAASGTFLEDWQVFGRMQSYLGSTALGSIIATTIVLFSILKFSKFFVALFLPIMLVGILLTFQRGGFIALLVAIIYTLVKMRGTLKFKFLLPIIFLLLSTVGIIFYSQLEPEILNRLLAQYSMSSLYDTISSERQRGYGPGLSYFKDFPMGVGLGATSSIAADMGLATRGQVVDANFMRILADLGLLGLLSFFAVLLAASRAALKRENGFGWLLLFGLIAAICIGTNTLDSYYVSHSFWLFLGVIDTKASKKYSVINMQHGSFKG